MADLELAELFAEAAGGERRAVVAAEGQLARQDPVRLGGLVDDGDRFVGAAAKAQLPADVAAPFVGSGLGRRPAG